LNGSNDVLQAGIEQKVDVNGNATYLAWYEWFAPAVSGSPGYIYQTNISMSVSAGDEVGCVIQYFPNQQAGSISFGNSTTNENFAITLAPPPGASFSGACAEWIMEAPDGGEPTSALPSFTAVTFIDAQACTSDQDVSQADPNSGILVNLIDTSGTVLTSTSATDSTATITFIG
jgi:hypothetical protein